MSWLDAAVATIERIGLVQSLMAETIREPLGLKMYRKLTRVGSPIAHFALRRRLEAGKEDAGRISERRGVASVERPVGELFWIHGASVGESLSIIPLINRLHEMRPKINILVTTGTVTSAQLLADRLPRNVIHQYIPVDHPAYVESFLDHWRPDAAIFVESEFWPNLILTTREKTPYMALINGRVSPRSYEDWKRQPNSIKYILSSFDLLIGQDQHNATRLQSLSGAKVGMFGNLKHAADTLPVQADELNKFRIALNDRPVWLATSTHPGEEETIIAAHKILRQEFPNILTIIAPRHPKRGAEINSLIEENNFKSATRSKAEQCSDDVDFYVADTLGELGLFYRLSNVAFIGGSLAAKGGHNPLEPARIGCAILHGPNIFNFDETYGDIRNAGGAALIRNDRELAAAVRRLLADTKTRVAMSNAAKISAESSAEKVLSDISTNLLNNYVKLTAAT